MAKDLDGFKYMSFDVVGTLIDFEGGLVRSLSTIAAEAGVGLDAEAALSHYRAARYMPGVQPFPDDLARCYTVIAPQLGLPVEQRFARQMVDDVALWTGFPDSARALARLARRYRLIAMTNAQRWAFDLFDAALGRPFFATFTADETGCEKPDPAFFQTVFAYVGAQGDTQDDMLHVAQSQYHDIGISRRLGMTNCWIERRHAQPGYGGTIAPDALTVPDYHFTSMAALADAALGPVSA